MIKVRIGPSAFGKDDDTPLKLLHNAGINILPNPWGRRFTREETIEMLKDADGLIAGLEPLDADVLAAAPSLKVISRCGAGMNNVDISAAKERNIAVFNTPDGPVDSVAEMTLGCILTGLREIPRMNSALHQGNWLKLNGRLLAQQTIAIIGCGRIGQRVLALLRPFGCRIIVVDPALKQAPAGSTLMSLEDALPQADIITIHVSGDSCILDQHAIEATRPGVFIANAARGACVDENALVNGIESGHVAGAWLDALPREPYEGSLQAFDQVLMTPHTGSYTKEGRLKMETDCVSNLLKGFNIK